VKAAAAPAKVKRPVAKAKSRAVSGHSKAAGMGAQTGGAPK
jgi:hypothetical protein